MESTANRQHLGERAAMVSGDPWEQDITLLLFLQHTCQQQTPMAEEKTSDPDSRGEMAPAATKGSAECWQWVTLCSEALKCLSAGLTY